MPNRGTLEKLPEITEFSLSLAHKDAVLTEKVSWFNASTGLCFWVVFSFVLDNLFESPYNALWQRHPYGRKMSPVLFNLPKTSDGSWDFKWVFNF